MIEKLRKRVIKLTMIAVLIVLVLLMGIVNVANYVSTDKSMTELLDLLEANGGTFSVFDHGGPSSGPNGAMGPDSNMSGGSGTDSDLSGSSGTDSGTSGNGNWAQGTTGQQGIPLGGNSNDLDGPKVELEPKGADDFDGDGKGQGGWKHDDMKPWMTKETPYETRFFSVTLDDETSEMLRIDTSRIAAIDKAAATEMAANLAKTGKTSGYTNSSGSIYKYRAVPITDAAGSTADASDVASSGSAAGSTADASDVTSSGSTAGSSDTAATGNTTGSSNTAAGTGSSTMYIFVDATRSLESVQKFLLISILVSLGGLIAIGALVVAMSPLMVRPIAESYEKQKKFITNASHELKTPMAVIKSCNDVSAMQNGETKWTRAIGEQIDRLTVLTNRLVALSKMDEAIDSGFDLSGETMTKEEVAFDALVFDCIKPFKLVAQQKNIPFSYVPETAGKSVTLMGNKGYLTELINILADNAIKYCALGGSVRFTLSQSGNKVILTEENDAEGLTPGSQNVLFDRFYRGDQSHSKSQDDKGTVAAAGTPGGSSSLAAAGTPGGSSSLAAAGTPGGFGIGLSMAEAIVNAHGGTITADSPDGQRIIFKVELPKS